MIVMWLLCGICAGICLIYSFVTGDDKDGRTVSFVILFGSCAMIKLTEIYKMVNAHLEMHITLVKKEYRL